MEAGTKKVIGFSIGIGSIITAFVVSSFFPELTLAMLVVVYLSATGIVVVGLIWPNE